MQRTLGIFVSSGEHFDKILKICRAARKKEVEITIFFTHTGVLLTQHPKFTELVEMASMSVCNVSVEKHGLDPTLPGIAEKDYATQARHGMLIRDCDRYIVF